MWIARRQGIAGFAILILMTAWGLASGADDVRAQAAASAPEQVEGTAAVPLPEPLTREALRDLLARLSDAEVRELLIAQLDQEIGEAGSGDQAMIGGMDQQARALRESWRAMFAAVTELPHVPLFFADQLIGERSPITLVWIAFGLAAIFAVGVLAEQLYLRAVRDVRRQCHAAQPPTAAAAALSSSPVIDGRLDDVAWDPEEAGDPEDLEVDPDEDADADDDEFEDDDEFDDEDDADVEPVGVSRTALQGVACHEGTEVLAVIGMNKYGMPHAVASPSPSRESFHLRTIFLASPRWRHA